ncbi:MAG: NTP transferase domain-containing protein [Desulfobacterales bacterium]|nr:NTP transferase domain-containing protein [Desulfobacterales bacterium]
MEPYPLSAIVIADGRQLSAADAAAPAMPDPPQLERARAAVAPLATDIVWVAADPSTLLAWDGLIVSDHGQPPDLLSAIHAGLFAARHDQALVLAASQALPSGAVLALLRRSAAPRWDGVFLEAAATAQPLPAIYHKRCLKLLSRQLGEGRRQAGGFMRQLHRHLIAEDLVRQADGQWAPLFAPEDRRSAEP